MNIIKVVMVGMYAYIPSEQLMFFLQKVVRSRKSKIDRVTLSLRIGVPSVFKIVHLKSKIAQVLRYGGLKIELFYKNKLSQTG
jgi:hypothetical protein